MSKIPNCYAPDAFFKLKMHQNLFLPLPLLGQLRQYDTPPDSLVGWGGDTPSHSPFPFPSTPSTSRSRRIRRLDSRRLRCFQDRTPLFSPIN